MSQESDTEELTPLERLQERHRKEKKDVQAKVTTLRRSIAKGDKKQKKEATAQIDKLEGGLKERHHNELAELESSLPRETEPDQIVEGDKSPDECHDAPRVTKAQKRREKKSQDSKKNREAEKEDKANAQFTPGYIERESINSVLAQRSLRVHEIPPDGDCLYNAIAHQLSVLSVSSSQLSGVDMRRKAATFIRSHKEDFLPFLTDQEGQPISAFNFEEYCGLVERSTADGGQWGGEPELRALSSVLERCIEVIQADGRTTVIGEEFASIKPIAITFHRFAYDLGEHYNSTNVLKMSLLQED